MEIKHLLSSLMSQDGRLSNKIKDILFCLVISKVPFSKILEQITIPLAPIKIIKVLVLLHNIHYHCPQVLETQPTVNFLSHIQCIINDQFQNFLKIKVIQPYSLYLQKKTFHIEETQLSVEQRFYKKLNLLQRSLSFCEIIQTFGRYYMSRYPFAVDFNLVIGKDVKEIYKELRKQYFKFESREMLQEEIERIHEKMYVVYYNCYFYKYLTKHIPKWIDTEKNDKNCKNKPRQLSKRKEKSSSTINSLSEEVDQSGGMSQKQSKEQLQESRLDLIKTLQRITSQ